MYERSGKGGQAQRGMRHTRLIIPYFAGFMAGFGFCLVMMSSSRLLAAHMSWDSNSHLIRERLSVAVGQRHRDPQTATNFQSLRPGLPRSSLRSAGLVPMALENAPHGIQEHQTDTSRGTHKQSNVHAWAATGLRSDAWRPMIMNTCEPGMPGQYAPCLLASAGNLQVAEEVLYPDFSIRSPHFMHPDHAKLIEQHLTVRFRKEWSAQHGAFWYYYLNQHGRNLVFRNTKYSPGSPPSSWSSDGRHCMSGHLAEHSQFSLPSTAGNKLSSVMFAASPDSHSFQHWSDRVAMMLAQTERLRNRDTKYISSQPRGQAVVDGWRFMANVTNLAAQLLPPGMEVHAESFIFACDTPLVHPYLMARSSETMLAGAGLNPKGRPLAERKVVVLLTRMNDPHASNGGRRWLNYKDCIPPIKELLLSRNLNETLEEWDMSRFSGHTQVMEYWSTQVRAAVGTHGGALYNVQYAVAPTMVVEIWPATPDGARVFVPTPNVVWEISSTKGLQHWALPAHTSGTGSSDVNVDCGLVVSALQQHLGLDYEPVVRPFYQGTTWSA